MCADRTILHCDLNGFFASVEALSHPEIGGSPMAVSGNPRIRHGIILAKNEAAKKFGVSTGEAIWQAKRKCPNLILLEPHHDKYAAYSEKVNEIYSRFTDKVEPFGIDESWLDVSESASLFGTGEQIADKIRAAVKGELGLTVSVGVSFNKVFAKLGSDYKKPDATTIFGRDEVEKIIWKLPVRDMLFVGESTAENLRRMGISTIGELAACDPRRLRARFGRAGEVLSVYARGEDASPVAQYGEEDEAKSVGNSITFERDLIGLDDIRLGVGRVAEKVSRRLKEAGLRCSIVQVGIKGADFSYISRQTSASRPTNLYRDIVSYSMTLVRANWDLQSPVRMLSISGVGLVSACAPTQGDLFEDASAPPQKTERAEAAFFKIREKFGAKSIKFGDGADG